MSIANPQSFNGTLKRKTSRLTFWIRQVLIAGRWIAGIPSDVIRTYTGAPHWKRGRSLVGSVDQMLTEAASDGGGGAGGGPQNSNFPTGQAERVDTCRPLMANPQDWQAYVNDIVFNDVGNVAMNPPYKIHTGTQSSGDFLEALKKAGWWWPSNRPNLNPEHAGGVDLQREVQSGKWIHITIFPGQTEVTTRFPGIKTGTKTIDDWSKPPRDIQLHCERYWLQPSSGEHLRDFLREKTGRA